MEELYQVNVTHTINGKHIAWVSNYSPDGYVGETIDTVYEDGVESTDWCIFTGTKNECKNYANNYIYDIKYSKK